MIDINSFFMILIYILGSILLVVLIVLGIKLINTVTKIDKLLDETHSKIKSLDRMFNVVDVITDSMAIISDKIVDAICYWIKKIFIKEKGKEEDYE